jgi:hypothetical protein
VGERPPPATARWIAAVLCFLYGFAKINGAQFTVLDSELTKPLGDVSGFWLTWYYFGYSPVYGTLLAVVQIVAGVLLVVPRTAVAGALVLLPIVTNIVLIGVFYGVDLGGTLAAVVLLMCLWVIIAPYIPRLRSAVLLDTLPGRPTTGALVALIGVGIGAFAFTWWGPHYNNRAPTSIDGVWTVAMQTDGGVTRRRYRQVFFEYNRAHMVVFRPENGPDERHHFEIDPDGVVRVWQEWLTRGPLIMEGRRTSETEIKLETKDEAGAVHLLLRRTRAAR